MTAHTLQDTAALTKRSMTHIARSPDTIITTAVMPIALMLLFVYVFGGPSGPGRTRRRGRTSTTCSRASC